MELNYEYIGGRYEKVRHSKMQNINEIMNLKHFQEEVERRIKKFEYVVNGSKFGSRVIRRALGFSLIILALLVWTFIGVTFFKSNPDMYHKLASYSQVFASNLGGGQNETVMTNESVAISSNSTSGENQAQKYFDCTVYNGNSENQVRCILKELEEKTKESEIAQKQTQQAEIK